MHKYTIFYESGWMSHCGSIDISGSGVVELTDEQVTALRNLARESGTKDVEQMNLKERFPDIYNVLDEAYRELAHKTETEFWMWDAYRNGYYDCDMYELMDYCKENLGFMFESEEDLDEEAFEEEELDAFQIWLDDYLCGLDSEQSKQFFTERMGIEITDTFLPEGYQVQIPEEICQELTDL